MKKIINITLITALITLLWQQTTQSAVILFVTNGATRRCTTYQLDFNHTVTTNRDVLIAVAKSINDKNPGTVISLDQIRFIFDGKTEVGNNDKPAPNLTTGNASFTLIPTGPIHLREREMDTDRPRGAWMSAVMRAEPTLGVEALIADASRLDTLARVARLASLVREMQTEVGEDDILDNLEMYGLEDQIVLLETKIRELQR